VGVSSALGGNVGGCGIACPYQKELKKKQKKKAERKRKHVVPVRPRGPRNVRNCAPGGGPEGEEIRSVWGGSLRSPTWEKK